MKPGVSYVVPTKAADKRRSARIGGYLSNNKNNLIDSEFLIPPAESNMIPGSNRFFFANRLRVSGYLESEPVLVVHSSILLHI